MISTWTTGEYECIMCIMGFLYIAKYVCNTYVFVSCVATALYDILSALATKPPLIPMVMHL